MDVPHAIDQTLDQNKCSHRCIAHCLRNNSSVEIKTNLSQINNLTCWESIILLSLGLPTGVVKDGLGVSMWWTLNSVILRPSIAAVNILYCFMKNLPNYDDLETHQRVFSAY